VTVSTHRLRHTMATNLATGLNPDLKSLQYLLGHTNLATTLEYVTPEMSQLRMQMSKLNIGGSPDTE
jgi:site-specific recombinase XerD